jgi:thiamine pyrophosphate-dependent acetolactate synthase large subunit-like protein
MGFSVPAAIAASRVHPERPVICLVGDAGLLMAMGELGLLARLGSRVLVVVMNDSALDLIRSQQWKAGKPAYGTEFKNPDFARIAEAFGIPGFRVSDEEQCKAQVTAALARKGPTLIEALIDPKSYPTTPQHLP